MGSFPAPEELTDVTHLTPAADVLERLVVASQHQLTLKRLSVLIEHLHLHRRLLLRQVALLVRDEFHLRDAFHGRHHNLLRHLVQPPVSYGHHFREKVRLVGFGQLEPVHRALSVELDPNRIAVVAILRSQEKRHRRSLRVRLNQQLRLIPRRILIATHGQFEIVKPQAFGGFLLLAAHRHEGHALDLMPRRVLEFRRYPILPRP